MVMVLENILGISLIDYHNYVIIILLVLSFFIFLSIGNFLLKIVLNILGRE